jgi:hypothetical protein
MYQETRRKYELEFNQSLHESENLDELEERVFNGIVTETDLKSSTETWWSKLRKSSVFSDNNQSRTYSLIGGVRKSEEIN